MKICYDTIKYDNGKFYMIEEQERNGETYAVWVEISENIFDQLKSKGAFVVIDKPDEDTLKIIKMNNKHKNANVFVYKQEDEDEYYSHIVYIVRDKVLFFEEEIDDDNLYYYVYLPQTRLCLTKENFERFKEWYIYG